MSEDSSPKYPTIPLGVQKARCISVLDLGTQENNWQGEISWKRKVWFEWEVPEHTDSNNEPLTTGKFYNVSFYEKSNLSKDLTSWRGKPFSAQEKKQFNMGDMLGQTCQIQIMEKDSGKQQIVSIMPLKDDINQQYHKSKLFSIEDYQKGNKEVFNQLKEGMRNIILRSKELSEESSDSPNTDKEEQVPF
tara:strand:- start:175 stop:744 length:570 start_codon:yes stop_codon:yes gene_type:complete